MAIHASPGVYSQILDYSTYITQLTTTTLGLVGNTKRGPSEPTYISSARSFTDTYGLPGKDDFSALAAISFLEYGNALWFKRLVGANATKASADIPTAQEKDDVILGWYDEKETIPKLTDGKQYIYEGTLDSAPIAGTVSVEIVKVEDGSEVNPIYAYDNKFGYFDTYTYSVLDNKDNYVKYDDGSFRFTLKDIPDNNIFVKYTKKLYSKVNEYVTLTVGTDTTTGTVTSTYDGSSLVYNSFSLVVNDTITLLPKLDKTSNTVNLVNGDEVCGTLVSSGKTATFTLTNNKCGITEDSIATVTCDFASADNIELEVAEAVTVPSYGDLPVVGDSSKIYIVADTHTQYKYDTTKAKYEEYTTPVYQKSFDNSCDTILNNGGVFVFDSNTHIDNDLYAILKDDNGKFKGDQLNTSTRDNINYVDYTTGEYRLVLSSLLEDRKIKISYSSNYEQNFIISSNKAQGTINNALVKNSISVLLAKKYEVTTPTSNPKEEGLYEKVNGAMVKTEDETIIASKTYYSLTEPNKKIATDNGQGNLVDSNGNIIGEVTYKYKNTSGSLSADIEIYYTAEDCSVLKVLYTRSMGEVTARNYGNYEDSTVVQFYKEDPNLVGPNYYGLNIWNSETYTTQTPTENFKEFTLADTDATTYFLNKVTSQLVEFTLYDTSVKPLFNYYINLTGGDDDLENVNESTASSALDEFADIETYDINLLAVPDYPGNKVIAEKLLDVCENVRGDCFCIIDPPKGLTVQNLVAWHNGTGIYANENALNSSYGALYSSWLKINNQFTESIQWVPPSVKMVAVYAYSDANSEVWFAPAGLNRGVLFNVLGCEHNLTVSDRDLLYATSNNAINPITKFAGDGIVAYGQKTLQRKSSALDRVNVMRLILYITKALATSVKYLLFEPHDSITWQKYVLMVEPLLKNISERRGLYYYSITCDATTNTDSDIDNNTMIAEVVLQPTKAVERIITRFKITNTGVTADNTTTAE